METTIKIISQIDDIFINKFLSEYLSRGFGSMSKRDIDVLLMHLLMEHTDLSNENNFNLSIKLKLTESKVKNLKYEANLKYTESLEKDIKEEFLSLLSKAKLQVIGKETWISIVVEDTFLRHAIKAKVKENGSFTDSSFNSEIVKISVDDFSYLMYVFSDDKEQKYIEKEITRLIPDIDAISFRKLFKKFIEEAVESAGKEVGKQGVKMGVTYLSGGVSILVQIFDTFKSYIEPDNK